MDEDEHQDDGQDPNRLTRVTQWAGKSAKAGASQAVKGSRVIGGLVGRIPSNAAEQAARATAVSAVAVRRRMPDHSPGEPVRPAILDDRSVIVTFDVDWFEDGRAVALLSAQLLLADFVTSREQDEQRWERMERVLVRQAMALKELGIREDEVGGVLSAYGAALSATDRIAFLVDLYFLEPFAPYTLKSKRATRHDALERIAALVGGGEDIIKQIEKTKKSAVTAHAKRSLGKIGYVGIGAAVVLGVAGFLAAPIVGAAIGTAAGLSGAAAVSHGLAILGGGALAAGGAGMAGGMWLVAGAGAAAGLLGAGGGVALFELGSATARGELVKLQITFKLGILDTNLDMAKAQQVITNLVAQADTTRAVLAEERKLNDDNARRVRDLETTLTDIEETIRWMKLEQGSMPDRA